MKIFTKAEVKELSTEEHPLFIYQNKVYDLTDFKDNHPGGDILNEYHGQDITEVMKDIDLHQHSSSAYEMMKEFFIGDLSTTEAHISTISTFSDEQNELEKQVFLDLNKPIFPQFWGKKLQKDEYVKLIHTPHHLKGSARFFEHPILEMLTRTPWYVVPIVWIPVVTWMLQVSAGYFGSVSTFFLFAFGVFMWTLIEYTLHRFLFHLDEKLPDNRYAMIVHFSLHGVHHFLPMDKMRLVFPPVLAAPLCYMLWIIFSLVFPYETLFGLMAGGIFGYILYDLTHYYLHHARPWGSYMRDLKSYHMDHHYKNYHEGYGVSNKLWDIVFDTGFKSTADQRIKVD